MTSSGLTGVSSLLQKGLNVLSRASLDARKNLALFVDSMDESGYEPDEQMVFLRGIMAIDNPRLFKRGAVGRQFTDRFTKAQLYEDIGASFQQEDVVGMYPRGGFFLEQQIEMMDKVANAAAQHAGVMMLLGLMRERLGAHYYHGLRAGIAFCSLSELFDPFNTLPLQTKLLAGIIHDVGKLSVPRDILFKPERLTREEMAIMTAHDVATEKILKPFDRKYPHLSQVAANHHLSSKINVADDPHIQSAGVLLRMADIYDALASRRDYKPPFPAQKVECTMLSEDYFPEHPDEVWYLMESFPCPDGC